MHWLTIVERWYRACYLNILFVTLKILGQCLKHFQSLIVVLVTHYGLLSGWEITHHSYHPPCQSPSWLICLLHLWDVLTPIWQWGNPVSAAALSALLSEWKGLSWWGWWCFAFNFKHLRDTVPLLCSLETPRLMRQMRPRACAGSSARPSLCAGSLFSEQEPERSVCKNQNQRKKNKK